MSDFMDENPPLLMECGDEGQLVPYHFVCTHLALDKSLDYGAIALHPDDHREVEYDYACVACINILESSSTETIPMIAMCIYCVRSLLDIPEPTE